MQPAERKPRPGWVWKANVRTARRVEADKPQTVGPRKRNYTRGAEQARTLPHCPSLPLDVWETIARHCDRETLARLALVSRALRKISRAAMPPTGTIEFRASELPVASFDIHAKLLAVHAEAGLPETALEFAAVFPGSARAARLRLTSELTDPADLGAIVTALGAISRDRVPELALSGPVDCGTGLVGDAARRTLVVEHEGYEVFAPVGDPARLGKLFEGLRLSRVRGPLPPATFTSLERLVLSDVRVENLTLAGCGLRSVELVCLDAHPVILHDLPVLQSLVLCMRPTFVDRLAGCPRLTHLRIQNGAGVCRQGFAPPSLLVYETDSAVVYPLAATTCVIANYSLLFRPSPDLLMPGLRGLTLRDFHVPDRFTATLPTTLVELHAWKVTFLHRTPLVLLPNLRVLSLERCSNLAKLDPTGCPLDRVTIIGGSPGDALDTGVLCRYFGARRLVVDYGFCTSLSRQQRHTIHTFGPSEKRVFAVQHLTLHNVRSTVRIATCTSLISLHVVPHPNISHFARARTPVGQTLGHTRVVLVHIEAQPNLLVLVAGNTHARFHQPAASQFATFNVGGQARTCEAETGACGPRDFLCHPKYVH